MKKPSRGFNVAVSAAVLVVATMSSPARAQVAPPSNDNFANAITLSGSTGAVNGTNVGATREPGEPGTSWTGDFSVWYDWTAISTETIRFDTCNNTEDPTLSIYTGNAVDQLTLIIEDDDAGEGLNPLIDLAATAGTTYRIRVDEYSSGPGSFTLRYGATTPACAATDEPPPGQADVASQTVDAGGQVSTDSAGDGTSADDPVETSVVSPNAGTVTIQETEEITQTPPDDYAFVGQQVNITAPPASSDGPLRIDFLIHPSLVPADNTASDLEVFRNGTLVPPCSGEGSATPDPCLTLRGFAGDDIRMTVLTSQASSWNAGARPPRQLGTPQPPGTPRPDQFPPSTSPSPSRTFPSPSPVVTVTTGASAPPPSATPAPVASSASPTPGAPDVSPPTGEGTASTTSISPNGDSRNDGMLLTVAFSETVDWTFTVTPSAGGPAGFTSQGTGDATSLWWGGTGGGGIVDDGSYRWQITAADKAGNQMTPLIGPVTVDTKAPRISAVRATPDQLQVGALRKVRLSIAVRGPAKVRVTVIGKRSGRVASLGRETVGRGGSKASFVWSPKSLAAGTYIVKTKAVDDAGNKATHRKTRVVVVR